MARARLRDVIIFIPGITGSVLEKDGEEVWAVSGQAAWNALRSLGDSIKSLYLDGDDPEREDLGDGITATRVMKDFVVVPGIHKIDGYSGIERALSCEFKIIPGCIDSPTPANYIEFPYDWRRTNTASSKRLARVVDEKLRIWRRYSGAEDARAILIAHSMGGLVSRHYLERRGGWRECRALITFGTPFRGSLNALDFLCNGYRKLFMDLSDLMRSFTSIYELLPIYEVLEHRGKFRRVAEGPKLPGVSDNGLERARSALAFHRSIEAAINRHRDSQSYREAGYKTIPFVGTQQATSQSARLVGGELMVSEECPPIVPSELADGDGTVPRTSAIPIEMSNEYRETYMAGRHGSLQNHRRALQDLTQRIKIMQQPGISHIRGAIEAPEQQGLRLGVQDLYLPGEAAAIDAALAHSCPDAFEDLVLRLEPLAAGTPRVLKLTPSENGTASIAIGDLEPGVWRAQLETERVGVDPVSDVFEVAGAK